MAVFISIDNEEVELAKVHCVETQCRGDSFLLLAVILHRILLNMLRVMFHTT